MLCEIRILNHKIRRDVKLPHLSRTIYKLGIKKILFFRKILNCKKSKIIGSINSGKLLRLENFLSQYEFGNDVKSKDFQKFVDSYVGGSYRELRLLQGLPVNGQRTRSNARTSKILNKKLYSKLFFNKKR